MENQNKNQNNPHKSNHKKRHHKPKSYFMTPADAKSEANSTQGSVGTNEKAQKSIPEQKAANPQAHKPSNQGHNRNRHKHKKHQNKQAERTAAQPAIQKNDENKEKAFFVTNDFFAPKSDKLERPSSKATPFESAENRQFADYEEFTYEELYGDSVENSASTNPSAEKEIKEENKQDGSKSDKLVEVVGIKFKESGKIYYFAPENTKLKVGSYAILKTARGLEFGEVAIANTFVKESETFPPLRTVARIATEADIKHHGENKKKEDEAFRMCNEKIIEHKLDMKLIDAQYTFDNSKLLFYFTSSARVDFRELVKDLAAVFRTRIELRQVGIRDEAKMVGGFGPCGRALCCSLFLTDFGQVSIKMAKEQNLSLNSAKISGICGRLMCCLRYEYEAYEYEIKHTPPVDTIVRTVDGIGTVTDISPMSATIKVKLNASPDVPPKSYKRNEVTILKKKNK